MNKIFKLITLIYFSMLGASTALGNENFFKEAIKMYDI